MIHLTPLGSSPDAVLAVVTHEGWKSRGYETKFGFLKQGSGKPEVVGVSSIQASLGDYFVFPFLSTNVSAFWGFDANHRLIDVWIWKTTDGP